MVVMVLGGVAYAQPEPEVPDPVMPVIEVPEATTPVDTLFVVPGTWDPMAKLMASDGSSGDLLGAFVDIDQDTALVGSHQVDNENGTDAGAAYIFEYAGGVWTEAARLLPSDGAAYDNFGGHGAVVGDVAVVGARLNDANGNDSGAVYVFEKLGGVWTQVAKLLASDGAAGDWFGAHVDFSGDVIVVGTWYDDDLGSNSGSAYVFEKVSGVWTQVAKLLPNDGGGGQQFGRSVAVAGDAIVVGTEASVAYIFEKVGGVWTQVLKLQPGTGGRFGRQVEIWDNRIILGAYQDVHNGVTTGAAYIFEKIGGAWTFTAKLTASDGENQDWFGWSVAIWGDHAIVSAREDDDMGTNAGAAYIFSRDASGTWTQAAKLLAADGGYAHSFGFFAEIWENRAIIGAIGDDEAASDAGAAYIFEGPPLVIPVSIDIQPDCINNNGHGVIPVVIFSDVTFNAADIDPTTILLEGMPVRRVGRRGNLQAHLWDANHDGFVDLVVQIQDQAGALVDGQTTAKLTGNLYDGTPIEGEDTICVVP